MVTNVSHQPRGETTVSIPPGILGKTQVFADVDYGASSTTKPRLTGANVTCRLVRNTSASTTFTKGQVVTYKADKHFLEVDALAGADAVGDGVIDEYLTSTGAIVNDYVWIVVLGPTKVINSGANSWSTGDFASTAASGKAVAEGTPESNKDVFGRSMETVAATADLLFRCDVDFGAVR